VGDRLTVNTDEAAEAEPAVRLSRVMPLYLVVFAGFVGYSLMIAIFTPLLLRRDGDMLAHSVSASTRTILLGVLLSLYPLAQFLAAPVIGALSDRYGPSRPWSCRWSPAPAAIC
jgi:nitrate/nitrite transporter NarK